jgi:hypothetical protein
LRIASTSTAAERLAEAVDAGTLEWDDAMSGGRGKPRYFRILKTASELRAEPHGGVFPPPDVVRKLFAGTYPVETGEQVEQNEQKAGRTRI